MLRKSTAVLTLAALFANPLLAKRVTTHANPAIAIDIDAAVNRYPIDPRIYGVAWAPSTATLTDLGATLNRWGGNAMSRYNWAFSTANRCKDYYFENIPDNVSSGDGSNGKSADDFIGMTKAAGAEPVMTIPLMGLLPKDRSIRCGYLISKYGAQQDADFEWRPDCGNGKFPDGTRMLNVNDPADTSAVYPSSHQVDWVEHLMTTWGSASNGGVRYYSLDNEPSLWSADHWDVHPDGSTYDEVWGKMEEYGAAIRATDPGAVITGIEEWGWTGYFVSGLDHENGWPYQDRIDHGGVNYAEWLLQQAAAYEVEHGVRILDVAALHFYPQSGEFSNDTSTAMQEMRNRSTRSLWDPNYVDESWIKDVEGGKVYLIPRLREWIDNNYPGTLSGITEYNWGAEGHINGGTAQADILGIFGRERLDIGVRWTTPAAQSPAYNAFKMYRNYDGNQSRFGDQTISTSVPDPDEVSAFASLRTSDGKMTVMIVAKTLTDSTPVTVNIANYLPTGAAERWQLDSGNAITQLANVAVTGSSLSLSVPAQSITLLVISGSEFQAPTNVVATSSTASTAAVTWTASSGATSYKIYRSSLNGPFAHVGTSATTIFNDSPLSANTTYLYKVQALAGAAESSLSDVDATTTTVFTDQPLTTGIKIKAVHATQLRTAVNAMRAAAGLTAQTFTSGSTVQAVHVDQLRAALDEARAAIGLSALAYTDAITPGVTKVKALHWNELRMGVK